MSDRRDEIAALVHHDGEASVDDLAKRFNVSARTIRTDLLHLESSRRIARRRGGAVAADLDRPEAALEARLRIHRAEKRTIARVAADLVRDGDTIALDASSTALYLARELKRRHRWLRLRVVTNSLRAAIELSGTPGVEVFVLGGRLRDDAPSIVMDPSGYSARIPAVDAAFVGATGFTVESGLFEATREEAGLKATLIANAREVVAIIDRSKWGQRGVAVFCPTSKLTAMVSDGGAPPALVRQLEHKGVPVRLVYASADAPEDDAVR